MADAHNYLKELRALYKDEKTQRRALAGEALEAEGVHFVVKNEGVHFIVEGKDCFIDFWPGTAKWISRDGPKGFGLASLIKHVKG